MAGESPEANNFSMTLIWNFIIDDVYLRSFGASESNAEMKIFLGMDFYKSFCCFTERFIKQCSIKFKGSQNIKKEKVTPS